MRWLAIFLLCACSKSHGDCPAALSAASKAIWSYNPVDKLVADAWSASITLEKALDDDVYRTTEKQEGNCHEIDRALAHAKDADVELLRRSAHAFRAEVDEIEKDPTEKIEPAIADKLQHEGAAFDTALAAIPIHDDVAAHPPTAADVKNLAALSASWCTLEASYKAALASRLDQLHAEQAKNKADIEKYGAQAKLSSAHWTAAQDLGRAIDDKHLPPAVTGDLATEPGFAPARDAIAAAAKACN